MNDFRSSVTQLAVELVRSPSRAGTDSIEEVAQNVCSWLEQRALPFERIVQSGELLGVLIRIAGRPGPRKVLLNACLDTADYGDLARWEHTPTSGVIEGDWLYGRGSADSKIAAAIFTHLASEFSASRDFDGELLIYFDGDEHTGTMNGIKAFVSKGIPVDFAAIGYPGHEKVMIGARGFLRVKATVYGQSSHSGAKTVSKRNAVVKAARLVAELSRDDILPASALEISPKLTVTCIEGGGGFALVPDRCSILVDIRLTEEFQTPAAKAVIAEVVELVDSEVPTGQPTHVAEVSNLPAYVLAPDHPLCSALLTSSQVEFGSSVSLAVCGPSNIGNLLALHGIPATCGFGVRYKNVHAPNECAFLPDVEPVSRVYSRVVRRLLKADDASS